MGISGPSTGSNYDKFRTLFQNSLTNYSFRVRKHDVNDFFRLLSTILGLPVGLLFLVSYDYLDAFIYCGCGRVRISKLFYFFFFPRIKVKKYPFVIKYFKNENDVRVLVLNTRAYTLTHAHIFLLKNTDHWFSMTVRLTRHVVPITVIRIFCFDKKTVYGRT